MFNIFKKNQSVAGQVKCDLCGMQFADRSRFAKHKEKAHPKGR